MKMKLTAVTLLIGILALGLFACAPGGGGSAAGSAMLDLLPAGDYQGVFSFKPAELFDSEFLGNFTKAFPMATLLISQMKSQMGDSPIKLEELEMVLVAGSEAEQVILFKADWSEDDLVANYNEENGIELAKVEYAGGYYWYDEAEDKAMAKIDGFYTGGTEAVVKKVLDLKAGKGEKFSASENFAKAQKYMDLGATFAFYSSEVTQGMDPETMRQQLAAEGENEETIEALTGAMENFEAVGGSFKVTNAINGDVAMIFADDASAKAIVEYADTKFKDGVQQAADSLENMAQMMNLNPDREKFLKLADKVTFSQNGAVMMTKVNIAWGDLAFLFEAPAQ